MNDEPGLLEAAFILCSAHTDFSCKLQLSQLSRQVLKMVLKDFDRVEHRGCGLSHLASQLGDLQEQSFDGVGVQQHLQIWKRRSVRSSAFNTQTILRTARGNTLIDAVKLALCPAVCKAGVHLKGQTSHCSTGADANERTSRKGKPLLFDGSRRLTCWAPISEIRLHLKMLT